MLNLYIEGTTLRDFFLQIIIWHTLQTDKQTPKQYLNIVPCWWAKAAAVDTKVVTLSYFPLKSVSYFFNSHYHHSTVLYFCMQTCPNINLYFDLFLSTEKMDGSLF